MPEPETADLMLVHRQRLLASLLEGDLGGAEQAVEAALSGASRLQLFETIVAPVMHEIGRLWEWAELTVAEEHMASEIVLTALRRLHVARPHRSERRGLAVVCCAPGEQHTLGAWMVGELLAERRWSVVFLGASAPAEAIARFVRSRRAGLLAVSAHLEPHLDGVREVTTALGSGGPRPRVLAGGAAFRAGAGPADVGADAIAAELAGLAALTGP